MFPFILSISSRRAVTTRGVVHRAFSSSDKKESINWGRAVGISAAVTTLAIAYNTLFNQDEEDLLEMTGPAAPQADIVSKVFFDVDIDDKPAGRIVFGLYDSVVPKTTQNFEVLSETKYRGCTFHRIIPRFMIQGGDYELGNGMGGRSIFGPKFSDESFDLKHDGPGVLSMANAGRDTNGSQFFITLKPTPHLDGKHVVFGVVTDGWETVKKLEAAGTRAGLTKKPCVIRNSGILGD